MSEPERPIVRVRSTFAPAPVCRGCYWEEMYRTLQRAHTALRTEMMRNRPMARKITRRREDDDPVDVVEHFHAHDL